MGGQEWEMTEAKESRRGQKWGVTWKEEVLKD